MKYMGLIRSWSADLKLPKQGAELLGRATRPSIGEVVFARALIAFGLDRSHIRCPASENPH